MGGGEHFVRRRHALHLHHVGLVPARGAGMSADHGEHLAAGDIGFRVRCGICIKIDGYTHTHAHTHTRINMYIYIICI